MRRSARAVANDASGHVFVTGTTSGAFTGANAGGFDVFVRKHDAAGNEAWTRQFGIDAHDAGSAIAVDAEGNVVVTGHTRGSPTGEPDVLVWKADADGRELQMRWFGSPHPAEGTGVVFDALGDVLVSGVALGSVGGPYAGDYDGFIRRYDADGTLLWTYQFETDGEDLVHAAAFDASGDLLVAGLTNGSLAAGHLGQEDAFVRKLRP